MKPKTNSRGRMRIKRREWGARHHKIIQIYRVIISFDEHIKFTVQISGDSGFESRAGLSPVNPLTRWPNGKAPTFCKNYSFCSSRSTTSKYSLAITSTREGESGSCLSIYLIMFLSYAHMVFRTQEDPTSSVFPTRKILKVSKALC